MTGGWCDDGGGGCVHCRDGSVSGLWSVEALVAMVMAVAVVTAVVDMVKLRQLLP
jgi:hypothetical protein